MAANLHAVLVTYFFLSLSKGKAKMKTESGRIFFLCPLQVYFTNLVLVARKPAFLQGKQNYQALSVYRSDLGENYLKFCS